MHFQLSRNGCAKSELRIRHRFGVVCTSHVLHKIKLRIFFYCILTEMKMFSKWGWIKIYHKSFRVALEDIHKHVRDLRHVREQFQEHRLAALDLNRYYGILWLASWQSLQFKRQKQRKSIENKMELLALYWHFDLHSTKTTIILEITSDCTIHNKTNV